MSEMSRILECKARDYCKELSGHEVLKTYWDEISLILKGSVARGNADKYSDIDFVFFCSEDIKRKIIDSYYSKGLINRNDGIFLPLPDWIGHYNFESYEVLDKYFIEKNFPQVWECTNVIVMHDPSGKYRAIIDKGMKELFINSLHEVKYKYLELQLTLDWMRHPLKRGDKVAVLLHCSKFIRLACQICYLLDDMAYPHDKWIFQFINNTKLGKANKKLFEEYAGNITGKEDIPKNMELEFYPQYKDAGYIMQIISDYISDSFGDQPWINEWYLFV